MSELTTQLDKIVTKEFLTLFGDKCKKLFKKNPYVFSAEGKTGNWICVNTYLKYNSTIYGFDRLYLDFSSIVLGTNKQYNCNCNIIVSTSNNQLNFSEGLNLGTSPVISVVFVRNANYLLDIYFLLSDSIYTNNFSLDCIAVKNTTVNESLEDTLNLAKIIFNTIKSADLQSSKPDVSTTDYKFISILNKEPYITGSIGYIYNQSHVDPAFDIVKDKNSLGDIISKDSFPATTVFDTIYKSNYTKLLDHSITFLYDWDNSIKETDPAVTIINPTLAPNLVVKIPIPNLFNGGISTGEGEWAHRVQVKNGIVINYDNTFGIPLATSTTIGGFKLGNANKNISNPIYIQLDDYGYACLDKEIINLDIHRDDLAKDKYNVSDLSIYYNNIFLHIGVTTSKYINGYFYKCTHSNYNNIIVNKEGPYTIDENMGNKLESFLNSSGIPVNIEKEIQLSVLGSDYSSKEFIKDIEVFLLKNSDSANSYSITKSLLENEIGIYVKKDNPWDTAKTSTHSISTMTLKFSLAADGYQWKQWDVLPRTLLDITLYEFISDPDIDYLFETRVTALTLDTTNTYFKLKDNQLQVITAVISPVDATNSTVKILVSDPTYIKYDKNYTESTATTVITFKPYDTNSGVAEVTITSKDLKYLKKLIFVCNGVDVSGITLDNNEISIEKHSGKLINATIAPINATDKYIIWTSSNENVARVEDGYIYGVSTGTATITCTTRDGNKTANCIVTVTE